MEQVVLVNERDEEMGVMEKMQAHREGKLHRAISVFIFNSSNQLLLQQRAADKYHSPGLWTNTCCSHPRPGEKTPVAAVRRLSEEMGMTCSLQEAFCFTYKADVGGLTEYEYDHVFTGVTDAKPSPNAAEVAAWKYMDMEELQRDVVARPKEYTEWFKLCITGKIKELLPNQRH